MCIISTELSGSGRSQKHAVRVLDLTHMRARRIELGKRKTVH